MIDALRKQYRLKDLLKMFQISKSSYCYRAKVLAQPDKYQNLRVQIQEIFEHAYYSYGYRRIYAALKKAGTLVSEKVVRRIMKEDGLTVLFSVKRKKYRELLI
ncbi:MAG: IS3 family transposase [Clostridiales bacterium]|nr:IS3 family transposase [Clostridiales bacterium]